MTVILYVDKSGKTTNKLSEAVEISFAGMDGMGMAHPEDFTNLPKIIPDDYEVDSLEDVGYKSD